MSAVRLPVAGERWRSKVTGKVVAIIDASVVAVWYRNDSGHSGAPWSTPLEMFLECFEPERRFVIYVAHPLGAPDRAGLEANLRAAMRWLTWLRRSFLEVTFVAPWIAAVLAGEDDADPAQREAGLVDADAVVPLLDGVALCGGRISGGMNRERCRARRAWDLTHLGELPPAELAGATWETWAASLEVLP